MSKIRHTSRAGRSHTYELRQVSCGWSRASGRPSEYDITALLDQDDGDILKGPLSNARTVSIRLSREDIDRLCSSISSMLNRYEKDDAPPCRDCGEPMVWRDGQWTCISPKIHGRVRL